MFQSRFSQSEQTSCFLNQSELSDIKIMIWSPCVFPRLVPGACRVKAGLTGQGRFLFWQIFRFNRLKCKWNAPLKWKFFGTNEGPSEVSQFFRSNWQERKLSYHLSKIFISTGRESARTYINFLRHHDLSVRLQFFRPHGKSLSF